MSESVIPSNIVNNVWITTNPWDNDWGNEASEPFDNDPVYDLR